MRTLCLALCLLLSQQSYAEVHSEIIFFLKPNGLSYLLERSIHTDSNTHQFHLDKSVQLEDILHISPARFEWDDESSQKLNSIRFDSGGFTLIYPGAFNANELDKKSDGVYQYRSWDGQKDASGRYGYWYYPESFGHFTYTWILPDNIELLSYRSNRQGSWTRRHNAVSFYTENKNNITFDMSYQIIPVAKPTKTPPNTIAFAASSDSDKDSITDNLDLCPDTPIGAHIDQTGCPLDNDHDGVPDGIDQCIASAEDVPVGSNGCAN